MPVATELPIDTAASADDMAAEIFGDGMQLISASYTGAAGASGVYSDGDAIAPGITPGDSGVILSTGRASSITNSSGTADTNTSAGTSHSNNTAGDSDLTQIAGMQTFDAAVLEAEFIPDGNELTMQIVFSSEEYLEYANAGFNDAVGVWVNGVQAELTVGDGQISIDNINDASNANLYVDNPHTADSYNTEMDGFTVTLALKAPVNPGQVNHIKIGVADGGDSAYDSNLLIGGMSVQSSLIAHDDEIEVQLGQDVTADLLANDVSLTGSALTITHLNGVPVSAGDTVTLASGEVIELTPTGFVLVSASDEVGEDFFTYTVADADGNTDIGMVKLTTTPCFTPGTMIRTPRGERAVEDLRPGDMVWTLDHGPQPLIWVGRSQRPGGGKDAPVSIAAGVYGAKRRTEVSPQHRLFLRHPAAALMFGAARGEVLARACHLVDGTGTRRCPRGGDVTYLHLMLATHEIVRANGILTESYQPGPMTLPAFPAADRRALRRALSAHGVGIMEAARPSLKRSEAQMLTGSAPVPVAPLAATHPRSA